MKKFLASLFATTAISGNTLVIGTLKKTLAAGSTGENIALLDVCNGFKLKFANVPAKMALAFKPIRFSTSKVFGGMCTIEELEKALKPSGVTITDKPHEPVAVTTFVTVLTAQSSDIDDMGQIDKGKAIVLAVGEHAEQLIQSLNLGALGALPDTDVHAYVERRLYELSLLLDEQQDNVSFSRNAGDVADMHPTQMMQGESGNPTS